jgi:hypothetical protein
MSRRFQDFCEETGRDWKKYANIPLFEKFADWVKGEAYMPTMDEAYRFIKSNPLTSAEILGEIRAQNEALLKSSSPKITPNKKA